jgi:hypothetical protein
MTWPQLVELGAPKMKGQFLASEANVSFQQKKLKVKNKNDFFPANQICWIMWMFVWLYARLC